MIEQLSQYGPLVAMMVATGVIGGLLAGLLGVGGGIVIVPVLETALGFVGVDASIRMHVAVATSLAIIIPTSLSSARAHHAKGAVDLALVKRWTAPILIGSVLGTQLATQVHSQVLALVFGGVAAGVALKMLLARDTLVLADAVPRGPLGSMLPTSIGTLSSMMGIGGGTLSVPVLTLLSQPVHMAVGTAALFGLLISLPGALGFVISGLGDPRLPAGSLGYVNVIGLLCIAPLTVLAAPFGARLAHRLKKHTLSKLFGLFLLLVATRMLYRALAG